MQAIADFFRAILALVYRQRQQTLAQRLLQRIANKP
jgi:hypothetical protein